MKDKIPLNWDRQYEDLLFRKGIKTFQDLFTKRNLLINSLLLQFIRELKVSTDTYELLRLAFSSSLRDTNIMSFTNTDWQSGNPTTWSKHAYWLPSQFCEVNVIFAFKNAYQRMRNAVIFNQQANYRLHAGNSFEDLKHDKNANLYLSAKSIDQVQLPSNSVDAIITDPPYGSNVQYLELSSFWYAWNKDIYGKIKPDFSKEAVSNRKKNFKGAKNMKDYEDNLFKVFKETYRILKPRKYMALTFNNKDIGAWLAVLIAIFRSGFTFCKEGLYYQQGVDNYKQTAHTKAEGSPYGDFIYVFRKVPARIIHEIEHIPEETFIKSLDCLFSSYLDTYKQNEHDKNKILKKMFLDAMPVVNKFVICNLNKGSKHNLYKHFGKNYLDNLYG